MGIETTKCINCGEEIEFEVDTSTKNISVYCLECNTTNHLFNKEV